jgi:hypothetical protein
VFSGLFRAKELQKCHLLHFVNLFMNKKMEANLSLIIKLIGKSSLPSLGTLWMCCEEGLGANYHPLLFVKLK